MLLGALAVATPALADDVAQREAQARFEEGLARVRNKDFEGALVAFQQANSVIKKPAVVWNLALTEEKTNRPVEALGHFREFLRQADPGDADRPRAQKHIDGLNAATGHIDVAAPAGATITLDGARALGAMPLADPVDVVPGHHDVAASLQGAVRSVSLDVVAGQTARADLAALTAGPAPGATALQANGEAPAASGAPGAGAGETPLVAAHGPGSERLIAVIAIGGAAVVAAGAGLVLGIQSSNAGTKAAAERPGLTCFGASQSPGCGQLASDVSTENNDHTASTVMWVVGGVLAAGAVGAFFLWPQGSAGAGTVTVTPAAGPGSAGLTAVGTF
jgi:hypothetical protein